MPHQNVQAATTGLKADLSENKVLPRISRRGPRARWLGVAVSALLAWLPFMCAAAEGPFHFQTNDVIAFVGGEDVVEMQRNGYLELLLTAALPHHKLRFRNLAFEGDTVFEQHRQLNFPSWEKQLERVGATAVIAQFGQAESLEGTNKLARFVEAYSSFLDRLTNGGRRILLLSPTRFDDERFAPSRLARQNKALVSFAEACEGLASRRGLQFANTFPRSWRRQQSLTTRDGLHLDSSGHWSLALSIALNYCGALPPLSTLDTVPSGTMQTPEAEHLRQLILEKNRLWFDYWRPQNWAFLNGDRTEQPSSRDHRDLKKRWFPEEMEKFLPLIEAKEKEIWEEAKKLR